MATWNIVEGDYRTFPAGEYYIGDACYVLDRELYLFVINYIDYFITNGNYTIGLFSTSCGNGFYKDTKSRPYCVDGGNISIIPIQLVNDRKKGEELGIIIKFENEFEFGCKKNKTIWIKDAVNPTNSFEIPTLYTDEDY
jgi:hypothetical protein